VVRETRCVARHDDACEYEVWWLSARRWLPVTAAAVAGAALLAAFPEWAPPLVGGPLLVLGAGLAGFVESARATHANRADRDASAAAFRTLVPELPRRLPRGVAAARDVPPADDRPSVPAALAPAGFRQDGQLWRVDYGGTSVLLKHSRGLALLAHLLRNPGEEIHVRTLDALTPSTAGAGGTPAAAAVPRELSGGDRDAGAVLDAQAKAAYRRRLVDLRDELADADACNDTGRASRARAELEAIADQLRIATGLGGRDRRASSDVDRVRVAVTRRIRAAITQIGTHHPALAEHLASSVRTGYFCVYAPTGGEVVWSV
jgi:non-specific serine/threonine protein kinase